ncbi:SDR family NAD(P)-dependent oxidoreductase [Polycladomyces subterraneus]|uniref:SDR family oxidoreductase n=1 Tax=Polycladomyces subterraneus TaxID=1016997 RepID=A0ABT8IRW2_9BACL|nr:SDR family oxidoreductase [Polycladomyces subterraneus]MDN4595112.1 SDR family oxidoreductase [Polycladomyces subterraneus]
MRPVALITGASSGIGRAFAEELANRGYDLVLVARRTSLLQEVANFVEQRGAKANVITADLTNEDEVARISQWMTQHQIDLLVNNAGIGLYGPVIHTDARLEQALVRLHIQVPLALTRAVLPGMITRKQGGIIQVSSSLAFFPTPYMAVYGAAKTFLLHYTEALAEELKGTGITVTVVCPGSTQSEFAGRTGITQPYAVPAEQVVREALDGWEQQKTVVVTGVRNRWITRLPRFLSRKTMRRLIAVFFRDRRPDR